MPHGLCAEVYWLPTFHMYSIHNEVVARRPQSHRRLLIPLLRYVSSPLLNCLADIHKELGTSKLSNTYQAIEVNSNNGEEVNSICC